VGQVGGCRGLGVKRGNVGGERATARRTVRQPEVPPAQVHEEFGVTPGVERVGPMLGVVHCC